MGCVGGEARVTQLCLAHAMQGETRVAQAEEKGAQLCLPWRWRRRVRGGLHNCACPGKGGQSKGYTHVPAFCMESPCGWWNIACTCNNASPFCSRGPSCSICCFALDS